MPEYRNLYTGSRALVIGINSYSDPRFATLGEAERDADDFGSLLASSPYEFQVQRLIGSEATKSAILTALFNLRKSEPDDRILFYFAGHGYTLADNMENEAGYLACVDTIPENDYTAIDLNTVIDLTRFTRAKHVYFIFDACFSGKALGLTRGAAVAADKLMVRKAYQILAAGAADQTVSDSPSMTTYVMQALRSGELGLDGLTTANELGLHVQQAIEHDSRKSQIPQFGHIHGDQGGDFVFYVDTRLRLPGDLEEALRAPRANARLAAVIDLIELANSQDEVAQIARDRLATIANEDPEERVRRAAQSYFIEVKAQQKEAEAREERQRAEEARRIVPTGTQRVIDLPSDQPTEAKPSVKPTVKPAAKPDIARLLSTLRTLPRWFWPVMAAAVLIVIAAQLVPPLIDGGVRPTDYSLMTLVQGGSNQSPKFSPDGNLLAFASNRDGRYGIYTRQQTGDLVGSFMRITTGTDSNLMPAYSPDGNLLAFVSDRDGPYNIYTMVLNGPDTGTVSRITSGDGNNLTPTFSPDGNLLAFASNRNGKFDIYTLQMNGVGAGTTTRSTTGEGNNMMPAFSPDGNLLAFVSDRDGSLNIYTMQMSGAGVGAIARTTSNSGSNLTPAFAADSSALAFASNRDGNYDIYVMALKGQARGQVTQMTTTKDKLELYPTFASDSRSLVFASGSELKTVTLPLYLFQTSNLEMLVAGK